MAASGDMTQSKEGKLFDEAVEKLKELCEDEEMKGKIEGDLQYMAEKYSLKTKEGKIFNDSIHGHIELHPLLVKIIDTPEFQRLRNIKQLGAGYWVYPGASHNRFEHSIGVAYLAGCLVNNLQEKQPELKITNRDKLCVQIAGLCHDLGHGPFSHLFDNMFIPEARTGSSGSKWKHEEASVKMFEHMVNENGLRELMEHHGLEFDQDMTFVKELIKGVDTLKWEKTSNEESTSEIPTGRPEDKSFLYEIVANKRNGIDVDKWDYFARDCHHLGISKSFDHQRLLKLTRVCDVKIKVQSRTVMRKLICFRDKEKDNVYDMFCTRYNLHRQAYQHKTVNIIEIMINDALLKANGHFQFSETIEDMTEYTKLTDHVMETILHTDVGHQKLLEDTIKKLDAQTENSSERNEVILVGAEKKLTEEKNKIDQAHKVIIEALKNPLDAKNILEKESNHDLQIARQIVRDITRRKLPKLVNEAKLPEVGDITSKKIKDNWNEEVLKWNDNHEQKLTESDFVIDVVKMDHGMKGKNLTDNVYYYKKSDPQNAFTIKKDEMTSILPDKFDETLVRVYYKGSDRREAENCFKQWCDNNFGLPKATSTSGQL